MSSELKFSPDKGGEFLLVDRIDLNDLSKVDKQGFPPLFTVLELSSEYKETAEKWALIILDKTRNPNPPLPKECAFGANPPIFRAMNLGLLSVVKRMLELGVPKDIRACGMFRNETLMEAANRSGNFAIQKMVKEYCK
ncbi:MAG TPA: hypothetical protein VIJ46_06585 [Rhabdochlamydiaceae bacterium]